MGGLGTMPVCINSLSKGRENEIVDLLAIVPISDNPLKLFDLEKLDYLPVGIYSIET